MVDSARTNTVKTTAVKTMTEQQHPCCAKGEGGSISFY